MMRSKPFKSCIPNPLRFYEKSFYILLVYLGCQFVLYALFLLIYALLLPTTKSTTSCSASSPKPWATTCWLPT